MSGESIQEKQNVLSAHSWVLDQVRIGAVDDESFDLLFPPDVRRHSSFHWSPLRCAVRAARLAVAEPGSRVLDVGAGAGKFCLIGSLATEGVFFGVEQRKYLVDAARAIADRYKIPRVQFDHGNMMHYDWAGFDSIYLYNPFSENLDKSIQIDNDCDFSADLYIAYIRTAQKKLAHLAEGTRVVTLNGFGGDLPPSFKLIHKEGSDSLPLELWIKG
ncbi:MAG: methyltransferase domain-containing protein [Bdellovibrionota bacterium]